VGRSGTDFPAQRLLALIDVRFQPSLDGLTTVPHVTAQSASAISLSPAWSVMIIFLSSIAVREHFSPPSQRGDLGAVARVFGSAAPPDRSTGCGLATAKDLSREATAGARRATRIEVA
jgi:hypothetical protein